MEALKKWKIIYDISTQNIKKLLNDLGFKFDIYNGESSVANLIPEFIEKLKSKNLISLDEGAYVASDNQDPPAIVVKSDGSISGYAGSDSVMIKKKISLLKKEGVRFKDGNFREGRKIL